MIFNHFSKTFQQAPPSWAGVQNTMDVDARTYRPAQYPCYEVASQITLVSVIRNSLKNGLNN